VTEKRPAGTEVGQVEAVDRDAPPFDRFKYSISDAAAAAVPFAVDADSGRLTTLESLDRELVQSHQFFVVAVSDAGESLASAAVTVGVGDVNDHRPRFAAANDTLTVSSFTPVDYVVPVRLRGPRAGKRTSWQRARTGESGQDGQVCDRGARRQALVGGRCHALSIQHGP